jgi:hypothetical protein
MSDSKFRLARSFLLLWLLSGGTLPAFAQTSEQADEPFVKQDRSDVDTTPTGQTARSLAEQVGQRQTKREAALTNPNARLSTRVQSRVQTRIRSRLDRYYDANPDIGTAVRDAEEEARRRSVPRRR